MSLTSSTPDAALRPLADHSVALIHEWFGATGGSEQVFLSMAEVVPHADRFVLWKDDDATADQEIHESWMAKTPLKRNKALALPLMPLTWRTLTRKKYDFVISSSHAFAHTVKIGDPEQTRHLSYVHSPARYVWSPDLDQRGGNAMLAPMRAVLQAGDRRLSRHVHSYAANSLEVQARIRRFWGRDARVINPPVEVDYFGAAPPEVRNQDRRYLLGVGRWIPYKNFDLMIEIAAAARLPLVIAGGGPEEENLRRLAARADVPVEFEFRPSTERLRELYWGAIALLYPALEDFGMIPVEAQACGTPVVGWARGGLLETVVTGETGFLLNAADPAAYVDPIRQAAHLSVSATMANAQRFTPQAFQANIAAWLADEA
ncbi:glycosyltransferase [Micromonospora thermarum]|uniref:Glycosyltransferase family 4 protein n=1 Tax=Micromonospora thermarum TaxID=2720024 RepID=A0ABX0Z4L2_9ACTN|nr:glycosyltransferase [Micromonospora thermarum]NJP32133.1 glycosyltransferase family 4 protein [Micromonospora thermarum]